MLKNANKILKSIPKNLLNHISIKRSLLLDKLQTKISMIAQTVIMIKHMILFIAKNLQKNSHLI